jgi:hypothetical protein
MNETILSEILRYLLFQEHNMLKDNFLTCIQGNSSHYLIFCCCFFVNLFCMQNHKLVVGFSLVLPMNR